MVITEMEKQGSFIWILVMTALLSGCVGCDMSEEKNRAGPALQSESDSIACVTNLTLAERTDLLAFLSDDTPVFPPSESEKDKVLIEQLKQTKVPQVYFRRPIAITNIMQGFHQMSIDFGDPELALDRRGVNFAVKQCGRLSFNPQKEYVPEEPITTVHRTIMITLYDALTNFCDVAGATYLITNRTVVILPLDSVRSKTKRATHDAMRPER